MWQHSSRPRGRNRKWLLVSSALLIIAFTRTQASAQAGSAKGKPHATSSVRPAREATACPPTMGRTEMLPAAARHHKLFLTWNPSVIGSGASDDVDGYCVYRSKHPNVARQNARCKQCERVTSAPISSTNCVDDALEEGARYYYVVTAVKDKGMSFPSNEISVQIPTATHLNPSQATLASPPFCRGGRPKDAHRE